VGTKASKSTRPPKADHKVVILPWLKAPMQRFVLPNWTAITIGSRIFAWRELDEIELAHELAHVRQWRQNGLMFIPRYYLASRSAAKAGLDRYRDNAFEKEATEAEAKARKREDR
jgi:hypothetical protein